MDESRIKNQKVEIEKTHVKEFFDKRMDKELPHRYNYVIYQDNNPELALERDQYEKEMIKSHLKPLCGSTILDIGCGVGRWADELIKDEIAGYYGIDFVEKFLNIARERFADDSRFHFAVGAFQDAENVIEKNTYPGKYDFIFVNGVILYINDNEIDDCLSVLSRHIEKGGQIYIKEGVGAQERFTLKDYASSELGECYNAIYRSLDEYAVVLGRHFPTGEFCIRAQGPTWGKLENRTETLNYYWIIERLY